MKAARMLGIVAVGLVLAGVAGQAEAVTHFVYPGQSIQTAIDASSNGDEIEVAPGTYVEAIDFNGKGVRLYSSGGADVTTIDANGAYHAVQCVSGEDANTILEGFTITGGMANGTDPNDKIGGGMYNELSSPTVTNCTFSVNWANLGGGGMYNKDNSSPTVTNCIFSDNTAANDGGGMYNKLSSPTVTNCIFNGNKAQGSAYNAGGGMYNELCSPILTNCTFYGNSAQEVCGGIYNNNSSPTVTNCILWYNTGTEIDGGSPTVSYSDVQGGYSGTGNIDADPLFVNAAGGDLRLVSSASPCVDSGNNGAPYVGAIDLAGNPRVVDGDLDSTATVDMGAYEFQTWLIHNINKDRWYETIQAALDDPCTMDGDEIEVGPGTYYEAIDFLGKAVRLYSSGGPNDTTIDGSGNYHVVKCVSGEDANTILEGFTISGGMANGTEPNDKCGGGMYNYQSSPTVTNCTFFNNSAYFGEYGGGMYNYQSSPTVTNCTFSVNWANLGGGGMYNKDNSNPTVTNCTFGPSNLVIGSGGGMYNSGSSPTVTNCIFYGNTAGNDGGGMWNGNSSPKVTNCIFYGNKAQGPAYNAGGGMYNYNDSDPTLTNCTFSGNRADADGGGGIYNYDSQTVTNCIFWANVNGQIKGNWGTVNYSCLQGTLSPGTGNINANPVFYDAETGDLRLGACSPCVDAGDNTGVPGGVTTDLGGNPRLADDANVPDTGSGTPPIVDMGAYERQTSSVVWGTINVPADFSTIQEAINEAYTGDQIIVAVGTYNENINFKGKAIWLYGSGGPTATTIDATGLNSSVVTCNGGADANTILEGFTITGGSSTNGGGMYCENSSPTVEDCSFIASYVTGDGGGMYNSGSSPTVTNCTFSGNTAGTNGGGMENYSGSSPTVTNCTFTGNTAANYAGGMYNYNSSPTVTNCIFWGDTPEEIYDGGTSTTTVTYSDVQGGYGGVGNIDRYPIFVDA